MTFNDSVETDLSLTDDTAALRDRVNALEANGGNDWPEDNFDAIERALDFDFRSDAKKIIVNITDATSHYDGDGSGFSEYTIDEVAADIEASGVAFVSVSANDPEENASSKVLANRVGGTWINIHEADFAVILQEITELVVTAYVVEYVTDLAPGDGGPISIIVDDPDEGSQTVDDDIEVPPNVGTGVSDELVSRAPPPR